MIAAMEAHNELEPVGAAGGRLIGTAVIQCALLMEYFLSTVISQALGAHNDAVFRPNILPEIIIGDSMFLAFMAEIS